MYRNRNRVERKHTYTLKNKRSDELVKQASREFNLFKQEIRLKNQDSAHKAIKKSVNLYEKAITSCNILTDEAYCRRKCASTIIRDESLSTTVRYHLAWDHLITAVALYEKFLKIYHKPYRRYDTQILHMELQRALVLLGHVALELRNGITLETATESLFKYLEEMPNPSFKLEALTYSYHVHLSKSQIWAARNDLEQLFKLSQAHRLPNPTDARHLAKINLLAVSSIENQKDKVRYFEEQVQNHFWKAFDTHKAHETEQSPQARNNALIKDFCTLLHMKIVQRINKIPDYRPDETVYTYIERQVSKVHRRNSYQRQITLGVVQKAIEDIKSTQTITLAYQLFENTVPNIAISENTFKELFPDYDQFKPRVETKTIQDSPLIQQSLFAENTDTPCDKDSGASSKISYSC